MKITDDGNCEPKDLPTTFDGANRTTNQKQKQKPTEQPDELREREGLMMDEPRGPVDRFVWREGDIVILTDEESD
ncbi:MAG: hypothetical protein J4N95_01135 [Chloroflexi bacterium]|nr:hypothetical protein [Chloroflexota bacterium]MCI0856697.1 hypothetical protein [Chloroflexota bacterium]